MDHVFHELQAVRRDLCMTGLCLQQVEALRRIDQTKASFADLLQSLNRRSKHSATM